MRAVLLSFSVRWVCRWGHGYEIDAVPGWVDGRGLEHYIHRPLAPGLHHRVEFTHGVEPLAVRGFRAEIAGTQNFRFRCLRFDFVGMMFT